MSGLPVSDVAAHAARYSHPLLHSHHTAASTTNTGLTQHTAPARSSARITSSASSAQRTSYNPTHTCTQHDPSAIRPNDTSQPVLLSTTNALSRPQYLSANDTLHLSSLYQSPTRTSVTESQSHRTSLPGSALRRSSATHTVHSPVQQNLSALVREKERELHQLHQYKQTQLNTSINNTQHTQTQQQQPNGLHSTQDQLNLSARPGSDSLHGPLSELRYELKQKHLHCIELERRIEQLHQLVASKDTDAIQWVEQKQQMQQKYERRVDKLNRAHAVELQSLRHEFEQAQQAMYDELAARDAANDAKTVELQQMLQSSELAFAERKRVFADKESVLQHQIATYATHALNYERQIHTLQQQAHQLSSENQQLKSIATSYEDTLNNTQAQLQTEQMQATQTIADLQQQISALQAQHQSTIDQYEQRTVELVSQLQSVEAEIGELQSKHAAEIEQAIHTLQQQHNDTIQQLNIQHNQQTAALQAQIQQAQQQVHTVESDKVELASRLQSTIDQHAQYVSEQQRSVDAYEQRIVEVEHKYGESVSRMESLNKKLSERETELGQHFVELQQSKSREKEWKIKVAEARDASKQQIEQMTSTYNGKLHDANERIRRLERELSDKSLALQAEQSRTSELTALVTTLRNVTSETARLKTMEQQQLLHEYNGNLQTVKQEINKLAISPRANNNTSPSTVPASGQSTKQIKLRTVALNELESLQQANGSHSIPPTPKLGNLVSVPMTSRQ